MGGRIVSYTFAVHAHSRALPRVRSRDLFCVRIFRQRRRVARPQAGGGRDGDRHHPCSLRHCAARKRGDFRGCGLRSRQRPKGHRRRRGLGRPDGARHHFVCRRRFCDVLEPQAPRPCDPCHRVRFDQAAARSSVVPVHFHRQVGARSAGISLQALVRCGVPDRVRRVSAAGIARRASHEPKMSSSL